jgi:hypothetical protein
LLTIRGKTTIHKSLLFIFSNLVCVCRVQVLTAFLEQQFINVLLDHRVTQHTTLISFSINIDDTSTS